MYGNVVDRYSFWVLAIRAFQQTKNVAMVMSLQRIQVNKPSSHEKKFRFYFFFMHS